MKKKILTFIFIAVLILFSVSAVYATETEIPDLPEGILTDEMIELTSKDTIEDLVNTPLVYSDNENQDVIEGNKVVAEDTIDLKNETIDGNLVVFAKNANLQNISVDGDVAIFAETINISDLNIENGTTIIAGQNINLNTISTKGNIYTACENLTGTVVAKGFYIAAADVKISGKTQVSRLYNYSGNLSLESGNFENVEAKIDALAVGNNVKIQNNLNYYSENEAQIDSSAIIKNVDFTKIQKADEPATAKETIKNRLEEIFNYVISSLVKSFFVCGFIFLFAKGFIKRTKIKNPAKYIGFSTLKGLGWAIAIPLISLMFILTGFGAGIGITILVLYVIVFWASIPFVSIALMNAICKGIEINDKFKFFIALAVTFAISVFAKIPEVGVIIRIIVAFAGMGIFMGTLKEPKNGKPKEKKTEVENKPEKVEILEEIEESKSEDNNLEDNK